MFARHLFIVCLLCSTLLCTLESIEDFTEYKYRIPSLLNVSLCLLWKWTSSSGQPWQWSTASDACKIFRVQKSHNCVITHDQIKQGTGIIDNHGFRSTNRCTCSLDLFDYKHYILGIVCRVQPRIHTVESTVGPDAPFVIFSGSLNGGVWILPLCQIATNNWLPSRIQTMSVAAWLVYRCSMRCHNVSEDSITRNAYSSVQAKASA